MHSAPLRLVFDVHSSESDIEQAFLWPFLTGDLGLGVPSENVRTKFTIEAARIDKGAKAHRYIPDYICYVEGLPLLIAEAKRPHESLNEAFREAQLYALQLNSRWPSGINPAKYVLATDGLRLAYGDWDSEQATTVALADLLVGGQELAAVIRAIGWENLEKHAKGFISELTPEKFFFPYEELGESRVRLAQVPIKPFSEQLYPLLYKYFQSENQDFEDEIIDRAYVSPEDATKYQRIVEDYLREKVAPLSDAKAHELNPTKRGESSLSALISGTAKNRPASGHLQLIIGSVGAGKTTFLKRYFRRLVPAEIRSEIVVNYIDFNLMPDDLSELNRWVSEQFIDRMFEACGFLDRTDTDSLLKIFSVEMRNNAGAYNLLKRTNLEKYNERVATDLLNWMSDPILFVKAPARHIGGERRKFIVVIFDNVDRRDKDSQLSIFQTAQWFRRQTQSLCLLSLRDETYEIYKTEPPLDTYVNALHFYIRPPRFVDMAKKRLELALEYISDENEVEPTISIPGLGRIQLRKEVGEYLRSIYNDLFTKDRRAAVILEGLAGRNVRRALEMFSSVLTSGHIDLTAITTTMLTSGSQPIQEASIVRALMRTNYLFFYDGHGYVRNILDFASGVKRPSHFLKIELLHLLTENRKRIGDARFEGYFSVDYLMNRFIEFGFPRTDVLATLEQLLNQGLIIADHLRTSGLNKNDLVRVHVSGYIHTRVLTQRLDYVAACALVTPMSSDSRAKEIGNLWRISDGYNDIQYRRKLQATQLFKSYLEGEYRDLCTKAPDFARFSDGSRMVLSRIDEAIGFQMRRELSPRPDMTLFEQ